jgi:AAT family amino acid transporter
MSEVQQSLERRLKPRHIMMITLGGTIGAGIFKGSSSAIEVAGPSVLVAYLVGGVILYVVMRSMAELALKNPQAKTLRDIVEPIIGPFAGYVLGWVYWIDWVLVMAAETAAASSFLQYWFPTVPLWILALIISIAMTALNLFEVNIYGEAEYWLAGVKIATLALFVILGGTLIFSKYSLHHAAANLVGHGGFFPHGLLGVASAMLVVMFSFGGIEMIGMTMGETKDPERTIPRAVRGVIVRVLLFYVLPILVILSLVPWDALGKAQSPFVSVFQEVGIPYVGDIMNFVLLTAVLSAVNTGMYATSRMLYTQASLGNAPRAFAVLSRRKVPVRALLFSTAFLYIGVIVAFFAKGNTFDYLMVFPGYTVILVWALLAFARLKSGNLAPSVLISFILILAILLGVLWTTPVMGTVITVLVVVAVSVSYLFQERPRLHN